VAEMTEDQRLRLMLFLEMEPDELEELLHGPAIQLPPELKERLRREGEKAMAEGASVPPVDGGTERGGK